MSALPDPETAEGGADMPWYVYDRHANLLHIASTFAEAEAWAFEHWNVASVGDREEIEANDYFYLLLARRDRVWFPKPRLPGAHHPTRPSDRDRAGSAAPSQSYPE